MDGKYFRKAITAIEIIGEEAIDAIKSPAYVGGVVIGAGVRLLRFGSRFSEGLANDVCTSAMFTGALMGVWGLIERKDEVENTK